MITTHCIKLRQEQYDSYASMIQDTMRLMEPMLVNGYDINCRMTAEGIEVEYADADDGTGVEHGWFLQVPGCTYSDYLARLNDIEQELYMDATGLDID